MPYSLRSRRLTVLAELLAGCAAITACGGGGSAAPALMATALAAAKPTPTPTPTATATPPPTATATATATAFEGGAPAAARVPVSQSAYRAGSQQGLAVPNTSASFASTSADMPNPDRGFYGWAGSDFIASFDLGSVQAAYASGQRLVLGTINLGAWRTTALPAGLLTTLGQNLAAVQAAGMKVTLLFAYDMAGNGDDATATQIQSHLEQLAPVLRTYAAIIPYMRAGFIGAWGEWHSSMNGNSCGYQSGNTSCATANANRLIVRNALLANVPTTTQIGFRYPSDLQLWYPAANGPTQVGMNNDCFLAGPTDSGTYANQGQRIFAQQLTTKAAFGGETCDNAGTPIRFNCSDILSEGALYHLAWLNVNYATSVMANWQAQGCYSQVTAMMGYRIQIDQVTNPVSVPRGGTLAVNVDLRNVGWARMFSARKLVVTLRNQMTGALITAGGGDLSTLAEQATTSTQITVNVPIPAGAAPDNYDVLLSAPDIFPATASDPRFAVQFANANQPGLGQVWNPATAMLSAGVAVQVY